MRRRAFGPAVILTAAATLFAADIGRKESPRIFVGGVVNAASFTRAPENFLAPNTIVAIFGEGFAEEQLGVSPSDLEGGRLPTKLGGVSVSVGSVEAPLFFVSPNQINALIPREIRIRETPWTIQVTVNTLAGEPQEIVVRETAPGLFPLVVHADFTLIGRGEPAGATPAVPGEVLIGFGTGFGRTQPSGDPEELAGGIARVTATSQVLLDGVLLPPGDVFYVGHSPGFAGLYQVNFRLPPDLKPGDPELIVEIGGARSQAGVRIAVEPRPAAE